MAKIAKRRASHHGTGCNLPAAPLTSATRRSNSRTGSTTPLALSAAALMAAAAEEDGEDAPKESASFLSFTYVCPEPVWVM
jgi:hypothetical protein